VAFAIPRRSLWLCGVNGPGACVIAEPRHLLASPGREHHRKRGTPTNLTR
jgi:hypothetical protein